MAKYERTVQIGAPPAAVWAVIADVERWPEWTPSILSVARKEPGPLGLASTASVRSKGFRESALRVTEFSPGCSFTWVGSGGPGLRVVLAHAVEPIGGGSRVTLTVSAAGPSAPLVGWLVARMSKRNVDTEAESLKQRVEQLARER
jgi:carbon monoxide dehydrogenase subunit G